LPDKTPFFAAGRSDKKVDSNRIKKFKSQEGTERRLLKYLTKSPERGF
jgi:hypothetical protein